MVAVTLKGTLSKIIKRIENVEKNFTSGKSVEGIAQLLNSSIQRRVQEQGKGVDNKKMKMPYTKAYAKIKKDSGRQTKIRDLTFSGSMWQALTTERIRKGARMFFGGVEAANKAEGNQNFDKFFGLSKTEKDLINAELDKITEKIKK